MKILLFSQQTKLQQNKNSTANPKKTSLKLWIYFTSNAMEQMRFTRVL